MFEVHPSLIRTKTTEQSRVVVHVEGGHRGDGNETGVEVTDSKPINMIRGVTRGTWIFGGTSLTTQSGRKGWGSSIPVRGRRHVSPVKTGSSFPDPLRRRWVPWSYILYPNKVDALNKGLWGHSGLWK